MYAGTQRLGCFIETLAHFRRNPAVEAVLRTIGGENDFVPVGTVPVEWLEPRLMGLANMTGRFAGVYEARWIGQMVARGAELAMDRIDLSVLMQDSPRSLTQQVSAMVREIALDCHGVRYLSRFGTDLENWAIFEPFTVLIPVESEQITAEDPELLRALQLLGLRFEQERLPATD
jgi:hypothetical protein